MFSWNIVAVENTSSLSEDYKFSLVFFQPKQKAIPVFSVLV